jgi:cytidylate kinase
MVARMIIAIDGPAASGKSTAARTLAQRLGVAFLDPGAKYRAVTREELVQGLDPGDVTLCSLAASRLRFKLGQDARLVVLAADGVTPVPDAELRTAEVTRHVSQVSAHSPLRRVLVAHQQTLGRGARASGGGVVVEGRDTTTVVFPDADHKFFLAASPAERARRRTLEEATAGAPATRGAPPTAKKPDPVRLAQIQREIEARDAYDSSRADSPLRQDEDALAVITDGLGPEAVVEALLAVVRGGEGQAG